MKIDLATTTAAVTLLACTRWALPHRRKPESRLGPTASACPV